MISVWKLFQLLERILSSFNAVTLSALVQLLHFGYITTFVLAKRIEWSDGMENNLEEMGNFTRAEEEIRKFTIAKVCSVP